MEVFEVENRKISNKLYNLGLERAKSRDLYGATLFLKKSLAFNNKNSNARNLLALIFYEEGEITEAAVQWLISRDLVKNDVNPANEYDIKVSCDYTSTYGSKYTDWSIGWIYDAAMAPVTVSGLKQRVWYCYSGNLDTVWNKQQAVTGYQYQLFNSSNKLVKSGTIARDYSAYENFDKLSSQTYKMRVRAYTKFNGKNRFGKWSPWLNIVPPVKDLTGKTKSRKIIVKWPKVKGATSYTIFVSTKRDSGWKKTKTVFSCLISPLNRVARVWVFR